jgi:hypothetical protein
MVLSPFDTWDIPEVLGEKMNMEKFDEQNMLGEEVKC